MPSTYSTRLRLELQATGENRSTWGTKTNNTINMIEAAISGFVSVAMGNVNTTLTTANGSTDQARNMIVEVTGAHTAVRTLTIPAVSKVYLLINSTTGGYAVSVKTSSGTAVTVPAGSTRVIFCDGLDCGLAQTTLTVAEGGTGAVDAATARTNLGLTIGTNVQAYDAGLQSISGLTTSADKMIYTTASDVYATTSLTSFARTLLDDADAATARTTLGLTIGTNVQAYDAGLAAIAALPTTDGNVIVGNGSTWVAESGATVRASIGADNASNLTTGTVPNARISGAYNGITTLGQTGLHTITTSGEAIRLDGPLSTDDPYITFYKAGVRQAYIQHTDGTGDGAGLRLFNDLTDDYLYLSNVSSVNALKFYDASTAAHETVVTTGNISSYTIPSTRTITAGNGMTGGGDLSANRTLTLGTPSSISNSTTNSVTSTSHTHALGFTAAEVYTGSDGNAVNFPIGHTIVVQYNANIPRNSTLSPALKSDDNGAYVNAASADAGAGLTGTWRSRGGFGSADNNTWLLAVRTA